MCPVVNEEQQHGWDEGSWRIQTSLWCETSGAVKQVHGFQSISGLN